MTSAIQPDLPVARRQKQILSAGSNAALLRLRNSFIQTAGYHVVTTKESQLVVEIAAQQPFDAVVLCNSMPLRVREELARELKKRIPTVPLVIICEHEEQRSFHELADKVVVAEHGVSQPLMEAIFQVAGDPDREPE